MRSRFYIIMPFVLVTLSVSNSPPAAAQNYKYPPGIQHYGWAQGQGPVQMMSINDGICGLTAVSGAFRGDGEYVRIENIGGFWQLSGSSKQQGVSGHARCVSFSHFKSNTKPLYTLGSFSFWMNSGDNRLYRHTKEMSGWGRDAACWLNGFGGNFGVVPYEHYGYVNRVLVYYNGTIQFPGFYALEGRAGDYNQHIEGRGACMSFPGVADPKTKLVDWQTYDSLKGIQKPTGVHIKDGICFFESLGGNFATQWDSIRIGVNRFGGQYLYAIAHEAGSGYPQEKKTPVGSARCIMYNQMK
jgi:hypothetical protein